MPDEQKTTTAATPTDMIGGVKPEPPIPSEPLTPAISMPPTPAGGAGAPGVTQESTAAAPQTPSAQPAPAPGSFGAGSPAGTETVAVNSGTAAPTPTGPDIAALEAALPVQTPRTGRRPMALLIVVVLVAVVAIGAAMAVSAMNKH
jgi:hypothetical protein